MGSPYVGKVRLGCHRVEGFRLRAEGLECDRVES